MFDDSRVLGPNDMKERPTPDSQPLVLPAGVLPCPLKPLQCYEVYIWVLGAAHLDFQSFVFCDLPWFISSPGMSR